MRYRSLLMGSVRVSMRLVALDLDGTLLRSDGTVSQRTLDTLRAVDARGADVVLVTQRPIRMVRPLAEAFGFGGVAICSNGAITVDVNTSKIVRHVPLGVGSARRFVAELRRMAPGVTFALERAAFFAEEDAFREQILRYYPKYPFKAALHEDILSFCEEPCTALLALHERTRAADLLLLAQACTYGELAVTHSGGPFIEVTARAGSKGRALADLAEARGFGASEVIAFGDMPNDLPMLRWAGYSVAMANAHPEVLRSAHEVTRTNDEDGVALVLERLLKLDVFGVDSG